MEDFLPALGVIIWVVLNILGVIGKKKKPTEEAFPETEQQPKGKGFFEELREQMKALEAVTESPKTEEKIPQATTNPNDYKSPGQEYKSLADQVELTQYEPISAEVLNSSYSNLEEGILDEEHQSRFAHHGGQQLQPAKVKRSKRKNLFKDVSPKEAFVYSLIFDRKHFDQL